MPTTACPFAFAAAKEIVKWFDVVERRTLLLGGGSVAIAGAGAAYLALRKMGSADTYAAAVADMRAPLPLAPGAADLVRYATLAANSHNTQPWRFKLGDAGFTISPDPTRHLSSVDPDDHHVFASIGCAAENLAIAARMRGKPGVLRFDPGDGGSVTFSFGNGPAPEPTLFDAIAKRQSTRSAYDSRPVSAADLQTLIDAAAVDGVDLVLITDRPRIDQIRDLVVAGTATQMTDPAFITELKAWLRYNPRQALRSGDGLYSAASGNPPLPTWLGPRVFDLFVSARSESDRYASQLRATAGIAVFVAAEETHEHWVLAGRASQRFALQATALGLRHAYVNQPVEVAGLRPALASLVGMPGRRPDLVMRFGYGPDMPLSARRQVASVVAA